jgi:hypothetical protein
LLILEEQNSTPFGKTLNPNESKYEKATFIFKKNTRHIRLFLLLAVIYVRRAFTRIQRGYKPWIFTHSRQ